MNLHKALQLILLLEIGVRNKVSAVELVPGLMDPATQPMFEEPCPNALHPDFVFDTTGDITVAACEGLHETGLVKKNGMGRAKTPIYGYADAADGMCTWPGRTFQVEKDTPLTVKWLNDIKKKQPLLTGIQNLQALSVIDTSLHWAYSLDECTIDGEVSDCGGESSLKFEGLPIVPHLHGGFTKSEFDGLPEHFFGPGDPPELLGPKYVSNEYTYDNDQAAGTLWYHDHALGITRLNVYAGMAGFYFIRDGKDTGEPDNFYKLPAYPYEVALGIQDRMFKENGELFYPAFPGDPFYDDFIVGEDADLSSFKNGGPTALAEFFGDFMVVNGKIWPKLYVEPRKYRLRLLNGCDSRFLVLRFCFADENDPKECSSDPLLTFKVIGSDQSLGSSPSTKTTRDTLVFEPGGRYDVIIDFTGVMGQRVIMTNAGCDAPFGGDYGRADCDSDDLFPDSQTDRIMAFDIIKDLDMNRPDEVIRNINVRSNLQGKTNRFRKLALFEGSDEFGRLQPLLGTAEPATNEKGVPLCWPDEGAYIDAGLADGDPKTCEQMGGTIAWHSPITERICLDDIEEWEVWNVSADAHPIHVHLVNFEIMSRYVIDSVDIIPQPVVQHNGELGEGFRIENPTKGSLVAKPDDYFEDAAKDVVTALPGQVTTIRMKFEKPGRYVWHCHILSHEVS